MNRRYNYSRFLIINVICFSVFSNTYSQKFDQTVRIQPSYYGPKLILNDANTANKVSMEFRSSNIIKWDFGSRRASEQYDLALWRYFNNSYSPVMWFNHDDGNVGIGTASPTEKLEVNGILKIPRASTEQNNSPGIVAYSDDDFLYDGEYINHYGFGFHGYQDATTAIFNPLNTYISGYFGVDIFTSGKNRVRVNQNGHVGIGSVLADSKLSIYGTIVEGWNSGIELNREGGGKGWIVADNDGMKFRTPNDGDGFYFRDDDNNTSLVIKDGGNLGVGTTNPIAKLEINSLGATYTGAPSLVVKDLSNRGTMFLESVTDKPTDLIFKNNNRFSWSMSTRGASEDYALRFYPSTNGASWYTPTLSLLTNGNVGIGKLTPTAKLHVNGNIIAEEIKVENVTGADFVFAPNYNLMPLTEIEAYIKQNHHLPEVPSAAEMQANGIELGKMNMLLLQKIEELTLLMIQMKKANDLEISLLTKEIEILKNR